jgi:hypothetical protein
VWKIKKRAKRGNREGKKEKRNEERMFTEMCSVFEGESVEFVPNHEAVRGSRIIAASIFNLRTG